MSAFSKQFAEGFAKSAQARLHAPDPLDAPDRLWGQLGWPSDIRKIFVEKKVLAGRHKDKWDRRHPLTLYKRKDNRKTAPELVRDIMWLLQADPKGQFRLIIKTVKDKTTRMSL